MRGGSASGSTTAATAWAAWAGTTGGSARAAGTPSGSSPAAWEASTGSTRWRTRCGTASGCRRCPPDPGLRPCLFRLDPARQVLPADCVQQRWVVGGHVPPDHPDYLVIAVAAGDVPAFASDQFHLAAPLWPFR